MFKSLIFVAGVASLLAAPAVSNAAPYGVQLDLDVPSMVVPVAGGCGPNGWRGPWGHCRYTPYYGALPNGYYQEGPYGGQACPPGYWRGPWGHCRNTPYHGRMPNGSWQ